MPVKPLPKKLVKRLERVSAVISKKRELRSSGEETSFLGRMKNVDARKQHYPERSFKNPVNSSLLFGRVRKMNVSRNYPEVSLVVKRKHYFVNNNEVGAVNEIIDRVNSSKEKGNYVLRKPFAYEIGNDLIAMAKTNKPSVADIIGKKPTERGKSFFRKLSKKYRVTEQELKSYFRNLKELSLFEERNVLLLGVTKDKKFIFMPLVDLY